MGVLENAIGLYMEGIQDGKCVEAVNKYTGDRYTQHSTGVRDGKEGFIEFFTDFLTRCPVRDIKIIRKLLDEDGRHAFVQVYQDINNGASKWVTTDFFDSDSNGKIVEHWDTISAFTIKESGRTSVDGPTEITDLGKTKENKQLVRDLLFNAFMEGGDPTLMPKFIADEYIQHNAQVEDGLSSFLKLVLQKNDPLKYQEIVLMVGQGNFVATLSKATFTENGIVTKYAQTDLFRIENGKVVEHWDNCEVCPPDSESVNGGKF